jgi:hypothetical protein
MRDGATSDVARARDGLGRIAVLFALLGVLGRLIAVAIGRPGVLSHGAGTSTFFVQYLQHEPLPLVLLAAFALVAAWLGRGQSPDAESTLWTSARLAHAETWWLVAAAVLVFVVTAGGTWAVMHALPFSMDEFVAAFQSRVFASGRLATPLPDDWKQVGQALTPVYVSLDAERAVWTAQYLPVYAALRAPFVELGLDRLVNPALAAVSVLLVYACARRLWPEQHHRAWVAVGFLATSSQFLFMSMTGYAMPAHLAANLLWLYAYLRDDRAGWIALPVIGVLALGIHNPFPHALFVAPFLVHLLFRRRWVATAYVAAVYLAGIGFWYYWTMLVRMGGGAVGLLGLFQAPSLLMAAVQQLSLTLILSWQTPVLAVAAALALVGWRLLSTTERLLVAGIALSFAFFVLFPSTQGHGWGYRYTYPVLGNLVLLGAVGLDAMAPALGGGTTRRLVAASVALTLAVQLPVRAWQIERYVRPFAQAHDYIAHIDAEAVIVDPTTSWYGIDLVRNDPFLRNRPKVLSAYYLRPADKRALAARFGDRVHMLQPSELAQFGVPTFPSRFRQSPWPPN